ncbi:MAG: GIY-YIG nuclease family protein, partial [bacterium]
MKTVQDIADVLKSYVYLYIDPRNNELFYVGKGTEDRLFAHLRDQSESKKVARIAEIRKNGYEPQIDVLRYGLSNSEAALVEAAVIDLIGKDNLTNKVSGYHSNSFGRLTSQELMLLVDAKQVQVK